MKSRQAKDKIKMINDEKKTIRITLVIPASWKERIEQRAAEDHRDVSPFICVHMIKPWIDDDIQDNNLAKKGQ